MKKVLQEITKFIYCMLLAGITVISIALFLDLFCLIFLGGWHPLTGKFPIVKGSLHSFYFPAATFWLLVGFGGMARMMLGKHIPSLLKPIFQKN